MKDTVTKTYTYTVHLTFRAESDANARKIAGAMRSGAAWNVGKGVVEWSDLTDADDWSEYVNDTCAAMDCCEDTVNRVRLGVGKRFCIDCLNLKGGHLHAIEPIRGPVVDENDKVDGYEIHPMSARENEQAEEGEKIAAYGVFEHYARGGVDWLKNFDTAAEARAYIAGLGGPLTVDFVDEDVA